MALADVSSFVREYQHLAGLDGDAAIIEAMQRDHEWTTKGSTACSSWPDSTDRSCCEARLALAIVLDIVDGSKGL